MRFPLKSVLCASDLSAVGDGAVDLAFRLAGPGATVHLLFVNEPAYVISPVDATVLAGSPQGREEQSRVEERVRRHFRHIVPEDALAQGIRSESHVLHESGTSGVIEREAKRLQADAIVLGTHGRTGLTKALLGSIAQDVMKRSKVPVVLLHSP